jgi:hypothetical protein
LDRIGSFSEKLKNMEPSTMKFVLVLNRELVHQVVQVAGGGLIIKSGTVKIKVLM